MTDRLARLADGHARRVLIIAAIFFVVAGVLGSGVADRLDPYGADDPSTESVKADETLRDAGYRDTSAVVLIDGVDPTSPAGRERVAGIADRVAEDPDVASVTGFAETGSRAFVSRDGDSTYLAVALRPTDDEATQDAADRIAGTLEGERGVEVGGAALAQKQVNEQVEKDLRRAELLAFPLLFLLSLLFFRSLVAALLPLLVGGLAIVGTMLMLQRRCRARLDLDLRPQPGHRARARAGDRLQPVHRLPLPRGARPPRPGPDGDAADDGDRGPHRPVQLADRRRRRSRRCSSSRSGSCTRWGSAGRSSP